MNNKYQLKISFFVKQKTAIQEWIAAGGIVIDNAPSGTEAEGGVVIDNPPSE